jgi:hypothetical protein
MNPRFNHGTRAVMAAVLLSTSTAQSSSVVAQSCDNLSLKNPSVGAKPKKPKTSNVSPTKASPTDTDVPAAAATASAQCGRANSHHDGGGNGLGLLIGALTATAIVGTANAADQGPNLHLPKPEELDADGPRFPSRPIIGTFQVKGYAAAGWPFAVDIYTQPGTWTWLEVQYEHQRQPMRVNLSRPEGGRHVEVIRLPGDNSAIQVARYSLHSALLPPGGKATDMPMTVYGIGAGPNAVGSGAEDPATASLYLAVTEFGPTPAVSPAGVKWGVATRRQFPLSRIEVLRYPDQNDNTGKFQSIAQANIDLLVRAQAAGMWGALPMMERVRPGRYALQARAWRTKASGGDWTGAFAPNDVQIK